MSINETSSMDPALAYELNTLSHQDSMNNVIDIGTSAIQQFYCGSTVFLTGGSGFIGKQLIEKLFRSCAIRKMYVLLRSKKGKEIQERLQYILKDPVFDLVRKKKPGFATCIIPIEGDVANVRLGLGDEDWSKLAQEVSIIFHAAATVRFDAPLQSAIVTNVRGTRDTLTLARSCSNLKSYVYVSTAYSAATKNRIGTEIYEEFYPCSLSPEVLISLAEEVDGRKINKITETLITGWPNTYTFTKAAAEEQIRISASDLPICVVRPPIVLPSYYEPSPGWLDLSAVTGGSGIILAIILGVLHVFRVDKLANLPSTPVDYVNNAIIAAGWDSQKNIRNNGSKNIPVYTITNKKYYISWDFIGKNLRKNIQLSTDKAVYKCGLIECKNKHVYWFLSWLFHYIPAYLLDVCCTVIRKRPMGIKSFVDIYTKMDKVALIYDFFLSNDWSFRDDNLRGMLSRMSAADKAIYNCDLSSIDFKEYVITWCLGVRRYIIKDGLNNTVFGAKKQKVFRVLNYVVLPLYICLLGSIVYYSFHFVFFLINVCFSILV